MTEDIRRKDVVDSDDKSRGMQDRAEYDMAHRRSAGRIDQGLAHRTFTTVCAGTDVVHGVDAIEHLGIAVDVAEIRGDYFMSTEFQQFVLSTRRRPDRPDGKSRGHEFGDQEFSLVTAGGSHQHSLLCRLTVTVHGARGDSNVGSRITRHVHALPFKWGGLPGT